MSFLLFLLFLVLIIALVVFLGAFNFVITILRGIFSFGRRPTNNNNQPSAGNRRATKRNKLLFDKNEAEDADFEEIK